MRGEGFDADACIILQFAGPWLRGLGRNLVQRTDNQQSEGNDEGAGTEPMVEIPTALLRTPVGGEIGGRPELDTIVDGNRSNERKGDGEELDGEGYLRQTSGEDAEMHERQQQEQVQEGGGDHPEWHDAAQQNGERRPDWDVNVRTLPVERGVAESSDVQLTAAHQTKDNNCQNLNHHAFFDVAERR